MSQDFINKALEILKDVDKEDIIYRISEDQTREIEQLIELDKYNKEHELRILRNYIVLTLSKNYKEDYSNLRENQMLIAILTGMIDKKLFGIGAEV